jgi:hypothetical protein
MTAAQNRALVRPAFLKSSLAAFLILLPFVFHALWDYVETRRLKTRVDAIEARGERLGDEYRPLQDDAATAERYYRAAAAIASGFRPNLQGWFGRVAAAERAGEMPLDVADQLRALVDDYEDALRFADRAALLPFDRIAPGYSYGYLWASLNNVMRLAGLRALVRAMDGDADGAAESLYTGLRVARIPIQSLLNISASFALVDIKRVVERMRPSSASLARLDAAIGELDRNDFLSAYLQNTRALAYQHRVNATGPAVVRPWNLHELNSGLAAFDDLVEAARVPWPQRIDNVIAVGRWPFRGPVPAGTNDRDLLESIVVSMARSLAQTRSVRLVVGIERYRRDHGEALPDSLRALVPAYLPELPTDPFSGQPMIMRSEPRGYAVYSVGANRRDDGGTLPKGPLSTAAPDVGVRVQYPQ